jgi:hypothetical protein
MDDEPKYDNIDDELNAVLQQSFAAVIQAKNGSSPSPNFQRPILRNPDVAPLAAESEHDPPQRAAPQPRHEVDPPTVPQSAPPRESAPPKPEFKKVVPFAGPTPRNRSGMGPNGDYQSQPYSEDAEKALISSLLLEPSSFGDIDREAFFFPAHRIMFDLICHWPKPEQPVDWIWAKATLEKEGLLAEVGGKEGLSEFFGFVPSAAGLDNYIHIIQEKSALRQVIAACEKAAHQCRDHVADPGLIINENQNLIGKALQSLSGAGHKVYFEVLRPSEIKQYKPPHDLVLIGDNHFVRGNVTIFGGAPGVGKSRGLVALSVAGATKKDWFGYPVHIDFRTLIIQNENGRLRLQRELAAINEPELETHLRISPPPPYGLCFWKREFRDQCRHAYENFGPHLVGLDPWNAVARDERAREYLETFDIIRDVFMPGDNGPCIVIVAHTRKPQPGERANGRALLNLLAGSYVLSSVPRTVFILQHASDDVTDDKVIMTCPKNNDGDPGERGAWVRQNGLFLPVTGFDWEEWDSGENDKRLTKVFTPEKVAEILSEFPEGLPKVELAKEMQGYGVGERLLTGQSTGLKKPAQSSSRKERTSMWSSNNLESSHDLSHETSPRQKVRQNQNRLISFPLRG